MKPPWVFRRHVCACSLCGRRYVSSWFYRPSVGLWCRACFTALHHRRPPAQFDGVGWRFKDLPGAALPRATIRRGQHESR